MGPASIPSPAWSAISLGPLQLRMYGLCLALGVAAAVAWARRRWVARGGSSDELLTIAMWAVPAGLVGARAYHLITDYQRFQGRWWAVFAVWEGGLGSWGAIAGGVAVGLWRARRSKLDTLALLDAAAPAVPLGQAIGRIGNWFNQELFGRPSDLPWAVRIDADNRPERYATSTAFHPAFLYEMLWNLVVVIPIVLLVERRGRVPKGCLFVVYVLAYTFGRFWIERLRIDPARLIGGFRINELVSIGLFLLSGVVLMAAMRRHMRTPDKGEPLTIDQ